MINPAPSDPSRTTPAAQLAAAAYDLLSHLSTADDFLKQWPGTTNQRSLAPEALPVCAWLGSLRAQSTPATGVLVEKLTGVADILCWKQTYTAADFGADFLQRYGWTELIGLRGPIPSQEIACGFLMLGPGTNYPAHAHEAEELYVPLAGTAFWMRGDEAYQTRPPGDPIHHPPWMPHAMRTEEQALLALYLWRGGDLAAKSRILRAG